MMWMYYGFLEFLLCSSCINIIARSIDVASGLQEAADRDVDHLISGKSTLEEKQPAQCHGTN